MVYITYLKEKNMIPDTIKCHKLSGTEIRHKNGHYYVYKVEGYYDKEAKKPKSRSLGCIGQIYDGVGFVPNSKSAEATELITKEYGATRVVMTASKELFDVLRECFPSEFMRIYVLAVLKLLENLSAKDIDVAYDRSAISVLFPKLHLSKNTVSDFLCKLSQQRKEMLKFMREYTGCEGNSIIFDGSSFLSNSRCNPFCEKGYSPGNIGKAQIRLIYAYNRTSRLPVYFRVVPGSTPDKAVFEAAIEEIGGKGHIIILDKGFFSEKNIRAMLNSRADFIIPLQKNTVEVEPDRKKFSAYELAIPNVFSYHKRVIYFVELASKKFSGCRVCVYYDCERRQQLMENYFRKIQDDDGNVPEEAQASIPYDTESFGITMLLTSIKDVPARQIYLDYKARWAIEEMFDTHKNTLGFNMKYETKYETQEGWAFIEFIALLMYHKINGLLISIDLTRTYNVKDILFRLATVTQSKASGTWKICNMSKPLADLFGKLGVTVESLT
jgi:hypothetical protein